jgi:hypothetical protein
MRVFFEAILDSKERDFSKKRIESDGEHLDLDNNIWFMNKGLKLDA